MSSSDQTGGEGLCSHTIETSGKSDKEQGNSQGPAAAHSVLTMSQPGVHSEATELLRSILVSITDALDLEEIGDPYMTLRQKQQAAATTTESRVGAVRVWQPAYSGRGSQRSQTIEKLVYMHLTAGPMAAQWIFAFSATHSLVPHFGMHIA